MQIHYSTYFDAPSFVDHELPENEVLLRHELVGNMGLLGLLERELGLTGIYPTVIDRVNLYAQALSRELAVDASAFYASAFKLDELGVAKDLLSWRDDLTWLGWQELKGEEQPARLKTLAAVESHFVDRRFHFGVADRWQQVSAALTHDACLIKWEITVYDAPEMLHPFFRRLFLKLSHCVKYKSLNEDINLEMNNLGKVKSLLMGNPPADSNLKPLTEDNSFAVVTLKDNYRAAEVLNNQIKQGFEPVIINSENALLDAYLVANELSATGSTLTNSNPLVIQLFKLVSVSLISPLNIYNLLSLLQSSYSPIPKRLSSALARQLIDEPGVGGEKWNALIEKYLEEYALEHPEMNKQKKKRNEIALYLTFNDSSSIKTARVKDLYAALAGWADLNKSGLITNVANGLGMQFAYLSSLAKALLNKLAEVQEAEIEGAQLLKWIESIYEPANFQNAIRQVNSVSCFASPANLFENASFVWWNDAYNADIKARSHTFLLASELEFLKSAGVERYAPGAEIKMQWEKAKRGILAANKQCVLVLVEKHNGEDVVAHPLLSEISAFFENAPVVWAAEEEVALLTAIPLQKTEAIPVDLPQPEMRWQIANAANLVKRAKESASSLESLIQHPFEWVIKYQAKLSSGNSFTLPELFILKGKIAHATTEAIFGLMAANDKLLLTDDLIERELNAKIKEQGLVFSLPEMRFEYEEMLRKYKFAIRSLMEIMALNGLKFKACELSQEEEVEGLGNVGGYIDLVLQNKMGEEVIFDLKWTKSAKKYQTKLEEGKAIQLALYAALLGNASGNSPKTAYFMFDSGKLYSLHSFLGANAVKVEGITENEVLLKTANSVAYRWEELLNGDIEIGDNQHIDEIEYANATEERNMIALDHYKKLKYADAYSGLELFKGMVK